MLYVYYGDDIDAARKKVQATVASMLAKNPDALYFRITDDALSQFNFDELTGGQALFKSEYIVVLDTLLGSADGQEQVLANLEKIAAAPHPFFLLDGKILAPVRKKLEKHAHKVYEFTRTDQKKQDTFNTFALTDALGEKDVKKLWTLFREAKHRGVSDEEIHGILFWMLKSMVLACTTPTPEHAGMKPFPYNKAKKFAAHFKSREHLSSLMREFVVMPQHTRRRGVSLEIELERFILGLT